MNGGEGGGGLPGEVSAVPGALAAVVPALSGADQVLAVVAHPDDESFGLGGLLAGLSGAGIRTRLLCLTPGEASTLAAGGGLAARREGELRAAAARLGLAGVVLAGYRDGALAALPRGDLAAAVAGQLGDADAVLVMEPSGVTGHPDHVAATAAAEAVAAEAGLPVIEWGVAAPVAAALAAELGVRLHPFGGPGAWPAELAVDRDRHRQAIACHVSQEPGNPLLRRRLDLQGDRELVRFRPAPYRSRLARFLGQAGPLAVPGATAEQRSRLLRLLTAFAAGGSWPAGALDDDPGRGYGVHCLHEDPAGWTLASIVTGGRRATPPHDHSSWGAAATVTGVERNTRYRGTCPGPLQQTGEQVAPPGGGYLVAAGEIHQAADATGYRTVSVHLLAAPGPHPRQHCPES